MKNGPIDKTNPEIVVLMHQRSYYVHGPKSRDTIKPYVIKKCGITNELDGCEENMFQGSDDDDDTFEGYEHSEIDQVEEVLENINDSDNGECSDHLEVDNPESDNDSPGH